MYKKIMVCVIFNLFGINMLNASQQVVSEQTQHEILYKQACIQELRDGVKDHAQKLSVGDEVIYAVARCVMPVIIEKVIKNSHKNIVSSELKKHKACAVDIGQFYNKTRRQDEPAQEIEIEKFLHRYMECCQLGKSRTLKL